MKVYKDFISENSDFNDYKKGIEKNLKHIVNKEQGEQIMRNLFPPKIIGYEIGDFYKLNEIENIEIGDVIYFKYWDSDDLLRHDDFGKITHVNRHNRYYVFSGGWEFGFRNDDLNKDQNVYKYPNSEWHFSMYKAHKKPEKIDYEAEWE